MDLRVQRTKKALCEAMSELLKECPLEEITVSNLCDAAMIRRPTFYKHFDDKYQFIDYYLGERCFIEPDNDNTCANVEAIVTIVRDISRCLRENEYLPGQALRHNQASCLTGLFEQYLMRFITNTPEAEPMPGETPPALEAAYIAGALLGSIRWWGLPGAALGEEEFLTHIRRLLTEGVTHLTQLDQIAKEVEE